MGEVSLPGRLAAIVLVDLLLAGDNALALLLLAAPLSPTRRGRALAFGLGLAVLLRIALAALAGFLLPVPGLSLLGGVFLFATALAAARPGRGGAGGGEPAGWIGRALLMAGVDGVLSLDNAVALAEVSRGSMTALALGVALSAFLMWGILAEGDAGRTPLLARAAVGLTGALGLWMVFADPLPGGLGEAAPLLGPAAAALGGVYFAFFTTPPGSSAPGTAAVSPSLFPPPAASGPVGAPPALSSSASLFSGRPSAGAGGEREERDQAAPPPARRERRRPELMLFAGLFVLTGLMLLLILTAAGRMGG